MATPAQIYANRLNAQRSTGPNTPEGKAVVAQNRTTHGLTGAFRVLPGEDRGAFDDLLASYIDEYEPSTPLLRQSTARERDALLARNPDFDPDRDTAQMSPRLRRWYATFTDVAA